MLEIIDVHKTFNGKKPITALKGVSFAVNPGEVFTILGPNGAGKTTLIKVICGLIIPECGNAVIDGISILKHRTRALKNIAIVLEGDRNLFFRLTGYENIRYFTRISGLKISKNEVRELAKKFDIADALDKEIRFYSKGMKQKVSLLTTLLMPGNIVLLDEPAVGLDLPSVMELITMIKEMRNEGKAVLLTTHQMNVAEAVSDRVAFLNKGEIIKLASLKELKDEFLEHRYGLRVRSSTPPHAHFPDIDIKFEKVADDIYETNFTLTETNKLFKIMDSLKENHTEILSLRTENPNLEEIFLRITGNK